jgi:hypothetical protein
MSDFRETVADRLERAADRMLNAGLLDEEHSYRDAAARVRGGLSLEETRAIEQRMLTGQMPRLSNRLTALAAQGEYDGGGGSEGEGSTASATGETTDEPILTEIESGASQLLSTAPSTGLSNPFSSAESGWISSTEPVNPYTAIAGAGDDDWSAYNTNGQSLGSYSGTTPEGDNPNFYTTGQNVNALNGDQNTDPFSLSPTSGQNTSLLNNPNLLALNDATPSNNNVASDAIPTFTESATSDTKYGAFQQFYTDANGVVWSIFIDQNGNITAWEPNSGATVIRGQAIDVTGPADPPPTTTNTQSGGAPATPPIDAPLTPAQEAQLNAAIQQAVASSPPSPVDAGQPTNINDVLAGTDLAPGAPTRDQPPDQPGSPPPLSQPAAQTTEQIDEENWSAAKSGMWDAFVDLGQGLLNLSLMSNPAFSALTVFGIKPSLDFLKSGAPTPTGNPIRDAQLLDNYQSGEWVTTTVSIALPIGAEGILDSALTAATKLPALEGMGMGGGGRLIGPTEQWLASFGETTDSLGPTVESSLAEETTAVQNAAAEQGSWIRIARPDSESLLQQALWSGSEYSYNRAGSIILEEYRIGGLNFDNATFNESGALQSLEEFKWDYSGSIASGNQGVADSLVNQATQQLEVAERLGVPMNWHVQAAQEYAFRNVLGPLADRINFLPY